MFVYFRYLSKVIFSKIPLWIVVLVGYIFEVTFLIIVPAITKSSPILIWNFDMINIQTTFITIEAIKSALLVGYAFKNDIEDGSELVIYSKPLKRAKILIPKLTWVILATILFSIGYVIISLFTMVFGKYDAINNPAGMPYDKIPSLIASLIIGPFIVGLIFSSLAAFIGSFANKLKIFVSVTIIAIVISIYDITGSVIMTSKSKSIVSKTGGSITSFSIKTSDLNSNNFAYYNTAPATDLYEANKETSDLSNFVYQILNISYQLSNFYKLFNLDDINTTLKTSNFGQYSRFATTIESKDDTLLNYLENIYQKSSKDYYPFILPISNDLYYETQTLTSYSSISFFSLGQKSDVASWLKYFGASSDDIWISNLNVIFDVIPITYISESSLLDVNGKNEEFDADIYNSITFKLLNETDFDIFNNNDSQQTIEKSKTAQQKFDTLCYEFIVNNKEKYGLLDDSLANINYSMAKIQYSMLKQFCMIYWSQIIGQLIRHYEEYGYSAIDYLMNKDKILQNSFKDEITIKNPYNNGPEFDEDQKVTVDRFVRCYLSYTGVGKTNSSITSWTIERFAFSSYGMDEHGNNLIDFIPEDRKDKYYFMFPSQQINPYNKQGYDITSMYRYTTKEFYTRTTTSIFWCVASFIFFASSMIYYGRNDIS